MHNFLTVFFKIGDIVKTVNDAFAIEGEVAAKQPVDLSKLAADIHTLINDFGIKLPPQFNNVDAVFAFIQAGIAALQAQASPPQQ